MFTDRSGIQLIESRDLLGEDSPDDFQGSPYWEVIEIPVKRIIRTHGFVRTEDGFNYLVRQSETNSPGLSRHFAGRVLAGRWATYEGALERINDLETLASVHDS